LYPVASTQTRSFRSFNEVEDFLRTEEKNARQRGAEADLHFWRVSANVYLPDHNEKVEHAASLQAAARRSLLLALKRLNGFLSHGTIPDNLILKPAGTEAHIVQAA
jgi:hypothetical protein